MESRYLREGRRRYAATGPAGPWLPTSAARTTIRPCGCATVRLCGTGGRPARCGYPARSPRPWPSEPAHGPCGHAGDADQQSPAGRTWPRATRARHAPSAASGGQGHAMSEGSGSAKQQRSASSRPPVPRNRSVGKREAAAIPARPALCCHVDQRRLRHPGDRRRRVGMTGLRSWRSLDGRPAAPRARAALSISFARAGGPPEGRCGRRSSAGRP